MREADLGPAEVDRARLRRISDRQPEHERERERRVDEDAAPLGRLRRLLVEVQLVRVQREHREEEVVGLRDRAPDRGAVDVADREVLVEPHQKNASFTISAITTSAITSRTRTASPPAAILTGTLAIASGSENARSSCRSTYAVTLDSIRSSKVAGDGAAVFNGFAADGAPSTDSSKMCSCWMSFRFCCPRSCTWTPSGSWFPRSARVGSESRIWPPCPAAEMRAARTTSIPRYPSSPRLGSPVCSPIRTRTLHARGHSWSRSARWASTAAATASRARAKEKKKE